jgi:hypothetical protein
LQYSCQDNIPKRKIFLIFFFENFKVKDESLWLNALLAIVRFLNVEIRKKLAVFILYLIAAENAGLNLG